jgi:isoleucyl-tRNA synthetase
MAKLAQFSETIQLISGGDSSSSKEVTVGVALANGRKCARCWNYSAQVPESGEALCERCGPVVSLLGFKPAALAAV